MLDMVRNLLTPYQSEFDSRFQRMGRWEPNSTDQEHADFLTVMVRVLKPKRIVETGTCYGRGTAALAEGCRLNRQGQVFTCDIEVKPHAWTQEQGKWIKFVHGDIEDLQQREPWIWDLAFIDGDHTKEGCAKDIRAIASRMKPGGTILIHDTGLFAGVRDALVEAVQCDLLEGAWMDTSVGVGIFHTQRG